MRISICACSIALIGFIGLGGPALGQGVPDSINSKFHNWSGLWGGIQAGGSHTQFDSDLSDGRFCVATASGDGATAGCDVGSDSAYASAAALLPGAYGVSSAISLQSTGIPATGTFAEAGAMFPGPLTFGPSNAPLSFGTNSGFDAASVAQANATDVTHVGTSYGYAGATAGPNRYFAISQATARDSTGTSSAAAIAMANILDFGSSDIDNGTSPAFGGHVHYDHQFVNNFILGVGADFLILPVNEAEESFADSSDFTMDFNGSITADVSASATQHIDLDTDALASARLRVGHAAGNMMGYVTGGVAVGDFQATLNKSVSVTIDDNDPIVVTSQEREAIKALGGVAGGGVSMWLGDRTALSFEALYYMFNNEITFNTSGSAELENITTATVKISYKLK